MGVSQLGFQPCRAAHWRDAGAYDDDYRSYTDNHVFWRCDWRSVDYIGLAAYDTLNIKMVSYGGVLRI